MSKKYTLALLIGLNVLAYSAHAADRMPSWQDKIDLMKETVSEAYQWASSTLKTVGRRTSTPAKVGAGLAVGAQLPAVLMNMILPSPLETVSRKVHADSFAATTPAEFRALQLKAKRYEQANAALLGSAVGGAGIGAVTGAFFAAKLLMQRHSEDLALTCAIHGVGAGLEVFWLIPLFSAKLAKAMRRVRMHQRYADHAEELFALMHNPAFMKDMGVRDWSEVANERKKSENWAVGMGSLPLPGLKSITKLIARNKKDINGLEKAFNKYLAGNTKEKYAAAPEAAVAA